jgi:endo-1,4-beta-xylanase
MHFSSLLPVLALASSAIAAPATDPACPGAPAPSPSSKPSKPSNDDDSLYKAMKKSGREFIGVAVTLRNSSIETDIIRQQFNSMTPENAMKWESTEPARGQFTFEDADRHVAFARENKLEIHCHNLVWHSQLPLWVSNGNFTNATLIQVMEEHIKALATRWKGDCTRWDVVSKFTPDMNIYEKTH